MTVSDLIYRVYWTDATGRVREEEFASLTEATVRRNALRREGITARIVGIRTTIG